MTPGTRTELDSHADTCVISPQAALVTHDFERDVQVHGYDGSVGATRCKTVSAAIAYDHPQTGETYMLTIHQGILIPSMEHNLLCPMQLRANDIRVNEEPKSMTPIPTDDHHSLQFFSTTTNELILRIPLRLAGVFSYFPTRKPTPGEYENCPNHLTLTAEDPPWDPHSPDFDEDEMALLDSKGELLDPELISRRRPTHVIASLHSCPQLDLPETDLSAALRAHAHCSALSSRPRSSRITAAQLAKAWKISIPLATKTLATTTQTSVRSVLHPTLSRRYRKNDRQLRYRRLSCYMFTDTMESSVRSWHRQNKYAQIFATRYNWVRAYPMKKKSDAHEGLSLLAMNDGVPRLIVMDGSKEQTMGEFRRKVREMGSKVRQTARYSPWQNAAEGAIREVKRGTGRQLQSTGSPVVLWDHCLELQCMIRSHTALDSYELQGEVPETILSGQTADISPFIEHAWYDWVYWWDTISSFPEPREVLGRWLGPSLDVGPAMTAKILKINGQILHLQTYRPLSEDEYAQPHITAEREQFDREIRRLLGRPATPDDFPDDIRTPEYELYEDDFEGTHTSVPDIDQVTPDCFDDYVGAEVDLPIGGIHMQGRVKRRARTHDGELVGVRNDNPILDTRTYEVEFADGQLAEFSANTIAENMFAQCDESGNQTLLLDGIVGHKLDDTALKPDDQYFEYNGRLHRRKTTKGVKLCVQWKNGSTSWEKLADLKESYPVEIAEYAKSQNIDHLPAFAYWVPHVLKRRDAIISKVASRYHKRTHKFGFEIPKTVAEAYAIDVNNQNHLWRDAIEKEMRNVRIAFKIGSDGTAAGTLNGFRLNEKGEVIPPPGHQFMKCHLIFDVKLDGFKRKARLVAGGHMTDAPPVMTYASVVSRDTVRIALTLAALNDLDVKASDVQNAYLTAPCEEKIWTILGPEFGDDQGKHATIVRALYGLKSAGASYRRHISDCMRTLGYTSCKADADLWMKPQIRPDGFKYYAYMLIYVDDCLAISHDPDTMLRELDKYFPMKEGSIGDPDIYLGSKLRRIKLDNGASAWSMSSSKYVQDAVRNVEEYVEKKLNRKLPKRVGGPWPTGYVAELDTSPELTPELASYYQSQIGILHWMVELGRIDMITEFSTLASHLALPREGHLDAVFHIFAYLKKKHNARLVLDPTPPNIDHTSFQHHDWEEFYGDVKEAIPLDAPEPRGNCVDLRMYVDSDHATDQLRRRSRSGILIFLNSALVMWLSKKQPTIETAVFGAEFVALKQGVEMLRGLRYKLRMMGVPISGPSYVYGDNMSVVHNTQRPESTLKKKSNSICYHFVREAVAMGECLITHIPTAENPADLATKLIPGGQKRDHLVRKILYDIADY